MARTKFICLVNATEGQDLEFGDWHSRIHMPEMIEHGGFISVERLKLVQPVGDGQPLYQYVVLYEAETDDPSTVLDRLNRAIAAGKIAFSPTLAPDSWAALYEAIPGARLTV